MKFAVTRSLTSTSNLRVTSPCNDIKYIFQQTGDMRQMCQLLLTNVQGNV